MQRITALLLLCVFSNGFAADLASLQRGARMYVNTCQGCHALQYEHYQTLANDLHIPYVMMRHTLMLDPSLPLQTPIQTALSPADAHAIFGTVPPDLSHIVRIKGTTFVRRYLKGFYSDPQARFGSNNIEKPYTRMPDVLVWLRGERVAVNTHGAIGVLLEDGAYVQWYRHPIFKTEQIPVRLVTAQRGTLTPAEFDATVEDIVQFLIYVDDPTASRRIHIGIAVIVFLCIWLLFVYALYRDTVKPHRNHSHE